ncbi:serpin family protein [Methanoregula sp.]|uniref:serpin family protein n=1 Tax=Methanoregula sp. TaxID=2052170 RepID=UPI00236BE89E|nr:serpin family protein [Methanoregula sp.]MDD1686301.1 serpin family protein [Methanoregula sp.]
MKRKHAGLWILVVMIIATILVSGCTGPTQKPAVNTSPYGSPHDTNAITPVPATSSSGNTPAAQSVSAGNNRFAYDLYATLAKNPAGAGQNLFYSPFSISSALAITGEGAKGTTADEIIAVFHFPDNDTIRREGFAGINEGINAADTGYTLRTANALWAEKSYPFLPAFTDIAGTCYSANVTNLDFKNTPEESRATINTWVEQKTENKIRDLLPSGSIDPLTRLVITNAVYFKGTWARQFDVNQTQDADFRTETGKTVTVRMMQDTSEDAKYRYAETDRVQYIELPYTHTAKKALSMIIILPKNDDVQSVEAVLDERNLSALQDAATSRRVLLYLPKFHMETEYRLPGTLSVMGMPTAFTYGAADFSGMDGTKNLYISDVIHKAFIDVNEEGTEAAAATGVVMGLGAVAPSSPTVFRADHPFVFLIQDKETGTILFIGRVSDPAGS